MGRRRRRVGRGERGREKDGKRKRGKEGKRARGRERETLAIQTLQPYIM